MTEVKTSLVADIGGTNVRFALVTPGTTVTQREQILHCQDFAGPVEAVRHYLSLVGNPDIGVAAFDVATAVTGDQISLTNGPWTFSIDATRDALGLDQLHVINDFTALALAVPILKENETRKVGGGTSVPEINRLIKQFLEARRMMKSLVGGQMRMGKGKKRRKLVRALHGR